MGCRFRLSVAQDFIFRPGFVAGRYFWGGARKIRKIICYGGAAHARGSDAHSIDDRAPDVGQNFDKRSARAVNESSLLDARLEGA